MIKKKTYRIQSMMTYTIVYGAWLNGNDWCWKDKDGATVYMPKEYFKVLGEW